MSNVETGRGGRGPTPVKPTNRYKIAGLIAARNEGAARLEAGLSVPMYVEHLVCAYCGVKFTQRRPRHKGGGGSRPRYCSHDHRKRYRRGERIFPVRKP